MAQELLVELSRRGIKLRLAADDRLDVLAPAGSLTPELRDDLRRRRDELITILRGVEAGDEPSAIAPRPDQRHEPFPLTDIQHAYWVGRSPALDLGGVSTHVYFELERDGLDLERAQESLRSVIDRHDMLRAVIGADGTQRVLPRVPPYVIATADLRGLPPEERDERLDATRREMDHQVLPADRWPLFDIRASRIGGDRTRLHVSLDTLILDGYSMYLLFQDWRRFYEEPGWNPEPLAVGYRDHVLGEEAAQEGTRYRRAREYWMSRLAELPAAPALPLATQPSRLTRTRFSHRGARMSRDGWRAIKRLARRHALTPSAVLMTAYADVLRHWSDQPDFTLDLTLFNRPQTHPQLGRLIGDFTSVTLLAVTAPEGEESFAGRAGLLQSRLLRDLEHPSFSGVRVMRERTRLTGGGPGASMPVVFTSALVLGSEDDDPSDGLHFFGEHVYGITQTPQVWLDHQVSEERGELVYNWDAVEELFPAGLLDDMFHAYQELIERLSRDEEAWERGGPLIALPAGQARERDEANATAAAVPARTLCDLVEEQARRRPHATAVIADSGAVTYGEVMADAYRLAHRLRALGTEPGTLVGVVLHKGAEQVAAVLGVTRSGAAYLPIDPQWPRARRDQLIERGRVRVVVTSPQLRDELTWPEGVTVVTSADPRTRACAPEPPDAAPAPEDLAYVIFTSGSTGTPKGVMIDHRGAVNTVLDINRRFAVGPDDRVLALSSLSFDLSVYDIFGILAAGGAVVMPSPIDLHDPKRWSTLIERHRVTVWNSVPALAQAWVDAPAPASAAGRTPRVVLLSGDWIPVSLPGLIRARHPAARAEHPPGSPPELSPP
ncbi:AMP-binding protein [Streptosporangium sp. NPDC048865]|uniref:AMP-binding protein n=1 Tax=Streptosporangium sp. NPDC048865 TaxID=3155766 RepID=UPI003435C57F